jgi:adenylate cyclase
VHWSKPLRVHLSVLVVALLLCVAIPLIWLAFAQGRHAAILAGEKQMREMSLRVVDGYRNALAEGYEAASVASAFPQLLSPPPGELAAKQDYLLQVLRNAPNISTIYTGYPDGSYFQAIRIGDDPKLKAVLAAPYGARFAVRSITQDSGQESASSTIRFIDDHDRLIFERTRHDSQYDPRRRPWYRSVLRYGRAVSVGPYVTAVLKSSTITMAVPMRGNAQVIVGVDIHLEIVGRLLNSKAISSNARSFIIDNRKRLVVHSDPAIMARIIDTLTDSRRADQSELFKMDETIEPVIGRGSETLPLSEGLTRLNLERRTYLAEIAPIAFAELFQGSRLAIVVPLEDLLQQTNRLLIRNLLIASALVAAGVVASILLSRMISRSLYQLASEARKIGDLDLTSTKTPHSLVAEINTLAGALSSAQRAVGQFALYVPREVVRRIVDPSGGAVVKASRQDVTVLFTDIRDFTTISEKHSPETVVEILSAYFECLNQVAERHGGTVVQYLGDSIFVMWNAPVSDSRHVENCCRCALEMKAEIDGLNVENKKAGRPELVTRFGVHTGPAVVGSFGAISRKQYNAMGDTINVASRLEGLNKEFNTSILVSAPVHEIVKDSFSFRSIGLVTLKGRVGRIEVFELGAPGDELSY